MPPRKPCRGAGVCLRRSHRTAAMVDRLVNEAPAKQEEGRGELSRCTANGPQCWSVRGSPTYCSLPALELQLKPRPTDEHDFYRDSPRVHGKLRCRAFYELVVLFYVAVHQLPFVFHELAWSKVYFITMKHYATEVMSLPARRQIRNLRDPTCGSLLVWIIDPSF